VKQENKSLLIKYIICFSVASLMTVVVFWIRGFFTDNIGENIQILSDGFFVSGVLMLAFAGMMFISDEGALIGIGFVLRSVAQIFIPMGRKNHEFYGKYRERVLAEKKAKRKNGDHCILIVGLAFLTIGIVFAVIWYANYYNIVG
jgi:ABC-type multidrug transport system fused ATPase/permease subunit